MWSWKSLEEARVGSTCVRIGDIDGWNRPVTSVNVAASVACKSDDIALLRVQTIASESLAVSPGSPNQVT